MLREGEERELDRKFVPIETWEEFLVRWKAIDTEQEAVGLLYAGARIPISPKYPARSEEMEIRVRFYIQWSGYKDSNEIADIAKQVIVKHLLLRVGFMCEHVETYKLLIEFLQKRHKALLRPPYPRFISQYLLPLFNICRSGTGPYYTHGLEYKIMHGLIESVARALLVWGLGYKLAEHGTAECIEVIEEFLRERKCDAGHSLMDISGYGEPIADLSGFGQEEEINKRAALALLKLRYWVGRGVHEKFVRPKPA